MSKQRITSEEKIIIEAGHSQAYQSPATATADAPAPIEASQSRLSKLKKGQRIKPRRVIVQRKTSPKGLRESDLIHLLQKNGVGRPSTYAQVIADLVRRRYAERSEKGELIPTARGREVWKFLASAYPHLFTPAFTAQMEHELDAIAKGKASYRKTIETVWKELHKEK